MVTGTASILRAFQFYMMAILVWVFAWICQARVAGPLKSMVVVIMLAFFSCFLRMTDLISLVWMWLLMTTLEY